MDSPKHAPRYVTPNLCVAYEFLKKCDGTR
jgi:hypothetical protein